MPPTATLAPADPTRRYTVLSFLQWLPVGLMMVPMVLLLLERGFSLEEIAVIAGVSSLSVALLELPTGGLADTVGRRPVLVVSALVHAVALVVLGLAASMTLLLVSAGLRGVSRALSTGPLEAWYVDAAQAVRPLGDDSTTPLTSGLARGEMAASVALGVGTLVGGGLPLALHALARHGLALPVSALAVPILVAAAVEVVRAVLTLGLPDAPRSSSGARITLSDVVATIGAGLRLAGRDRIVLRLLLVAGTAGVALAVLELITPAWLDRILEDPERAAVTYAVLVTVGFGADALGAALAPAARRRLPPARASAVATGVALAGVLGLTGASLISGAGALALAAVGYVVLFVGLGAAGPPLGEVLHGQVRSAERATVLSVQSLVLQLAGAAGALLAGVLVTREGFWPGFAVAAVALAAGMHLLVRLAGCGGRESAGGGSGPS